MKFLNSLVILLALSAIFSAKADAQFCNTNNDCVNTPNTVCIMNPAWTGGGGPGGMGGECACIAGFSYDGSKCNRNRNFGTPVLKVNTASKKGSAN